MRAVILAAGRGLRLRPLTETTPKGLLPIHGRPLLEHTLEALPKEVSDVFMVVGHLHEHILEHFKGSFAGKRLHYIVQEPLSGTGSAVHLCRPFLTERFLVVNGDDLYAAGDLEQLIAHPLAVLVQKTKESVAYSVLQDETGRMEGLEKNAPAQEEKHRVCGAYVLDERFFHYPLATVMVHDVIEYSLPHTIATLCRDMRIELSYATSWTPVGTPEEYERANA